MARARTFFCAAATAALLAPAGVASADEPAGIQGTLTDGVCHFAGDVSIPAGHRAEVDENCLLVLRPVTAREVVAPGAGGADTMPKSMSGDPDATAQPTGYPLLSGTLADDVAATVDAATVIAGAAANGATAPRYQRHSAVAEQTFYDEFGRIMYLDRQDFDYDRRLSDGTMFGFRPTYGVCHTPTYYDDPTNVEPYLTGGGPYDADVRLCWTEVRAANARVFHFNTGGWYETWMRTPPYGVPSVRIDFRKLRATFVTYDTGFVPEASHCALGGDLPAGWDAQCVLEDIPGGTW